MTEADYRINYMIGYGLGHVLHVRFVRNLHNNIVVEEATYYNADGDIMYVYNDDFALGRTIELNNMYIPQEYWEDARNLPLRTTYYKYQDIDAVRHESCNIWELEGLIIESVEQDSFPQMLLSDGNIYKICADIPNFNEFVGSQIITVEIVQNKYGYHLRIVTSSGLIQYGIDAPSYDDGYIDNKVEKQVTYTESKLRLFDSLQNKFVDNSTIVL